jgi:hypothetical protein
MTLESNRRLCTLFPLLGAAGRSPRQTNRIQDGQGEGDWLVWLACSNFNFAFFILQFAFPKARVASRTASEFRVHAIANALSKLAERRGVRLSPGASSVSDVASRLPRTQGLWTIPDVGYKLQSAPALVRTVGVDRAAVRQSQTRFALSVEPACERYRASLPALEQIARVAHRSNISRK